MYNLPRNYLSYSQIDLWLKNKSQYKSKYFFNEKPFTTIETIFGKEFAERLEKNDSLLAHIPRYNKPEYDIKCEIEGVPIRGFIDSYDTETFSFLEYKTSRTKNWTQDSVNKHIQLPFYSFVIKELHGKINDECKLIWVETRFKNNTFIYKGHTLFGKRELELTGRVEIFSRTITHDEREEMRKLIVQVAQEISESYAQFLLEKNKSGATMLV